MGKWAWWHQASGPDDYRIRELLRAIWDLHAMYGADGPWLWRGQANADFDLEPALHTRIRRQQTLNDTSVELFTKGLVSAARAARLDRHESTVLPDMALLAMLQHHGAATPLLDVSLDPMVGLYMAVVSPVASDYDRDGALFAVKRPERSIDAFDSRDFTTIYQSLPPVGVTLFSAPNVSERLAIQRGHFVIGKHDTTDDRVTLRLTLDARSPLEDSWIWKRMNGRGSRGPVPAATTDIAVFRVTAAFKKDLQVWLEDRSGLTPDFVFPTSWHQPHLDQFAASHRRTSNF